MPVYVIPKLELIIGWNPKAACTTLFYLLLTKLDYKIEGKIHLDMLNKQNIQSGKYGIYDFEDEIFQGNQFKDFDSICVIRNPYERLISGIRQRSHWLVTELPKQKQAIDVSHNTISEFIRLLKSHHYIEHHFYPQTLTFNNIHFDYNFDTKEVDKVADLLDIEFNNAHVGGHKTKYGNHLESYHHLTIKKISQMKDKKWSKTISSWFTDEDIEVINELYKDDFHIFKENGFDWIMKDKQMEMV